MGRAARHRSFAYEVFCSGLGRGKSDGPRRDLAMCCILYQENAGGGQWRGEEKLHINIEAATYTCRASY
ncbi:hypothetical protein EVAR_9053_1 [Eumeta japonica]|uniref:Uncharacterized protein n=1 Tax=Eumeta variegata TaxID=151549 RepID=A0A4C1TW03_EUMVA|nr:hypothetical protein EVAR_9053_1 [Eumeta japonica]